jgi:hypothetical protein
MIVLFEKNHCSNEWWYIVTKERYVRLDYSYLTIFKSVWLLIKILLSINFLLKFKFKKKEILRKFNMFRSGFAWLDVYPTIVTFFCMNIRHKVQYRGQHAHLSELNFFIFFFWLTQHNNQGRHKTKSRSLVTKLLWTIVTLAKNASC